jgi:PPK2 family polyphosphate:nucleotide phosphotransferase
VWHEGGDVAIDVERFRVLPGVPFKLKAIDPDDRGLAGEGDREAIEVLRQQQREQLEELQHRLYAEEQRALLVILLATDTGGKDSTVRHVFEGVNPQGVSVVSFRAPSEEELAHDFLWRIHEHVPKRGWIGIFNRSHYEDVTVPWVHRSIDDHELEQRYQHIRAFEALLEDAGTHVVKFHLRISRTEQAERLNDRLNDPYKHWKFDPSDLQDRSLWDRYHEAFERALNATSTERSPWYVVPANRKWFRNSVVTQVIVHELERMNPQFPPPAHNLDQYNVE